MISRAPLTPSDFHRAIARAKEYSSFFGVVLIASSLLPCCLVFLIIGPTTGSAATEWLILWTVILAPALAGGSVIVASCQLDSGRLWPAILILAIAALVVIGSAGLIGLVILADIATDCLVCLVEIGILAIFTLGVLNLFTVSYAVRAVRGLPPPENYAFGFLPVLPATVNAASDAGVVDHSGQKSLPPRPNAGPNSDAF